MDRYDLDETAEERAERVQKSRNFWGAGRSEWYAICELNCDPELQPRADGLPWDQIRRAPHG